MQKIEQHILLPKSVRKNHIDNSDECILFKRKRAPNKNSKSKTPSRRIQMSGARNNLLEFLNIQPFNNVRFVHTCHTCNNHSQKDWVCVNPKHLYFGTASENSLDRPKNLRKKSANAAVNSYNYMNKQTVQCKYCTFQSNPGAIANHEKSCKHKTI